MASATSAAKMLPERYPRLRDGAICFSMISGIIYFIASEGVRNFSLFLIKTFERIVHY